MGEKVSSLDQITVHSYCLPLPPTPSFSFSTDLLLSVSTLSLEETVKKITKNNNRRKMDVFKNDVMVIGQGRKKEGQGINNDAIDNLKPSRH